MMVKGKNVVFTLGVVCMAAIILLGSARCFAQEAGAPEQVDGIIRINAMEQFAPLERPVVLFPHDLHTSATSIKDCRECHKEQVKTGGIMFTYMKPDSKISKRAAMNRWHKACLGCHKRTLKAGEKSGPMACGLCHRKGASAVPIPPVTGFYDEQHDTHTDALDGGCELCHHNYDPDTHKLQYVEDEETACTECHGKVAKNGIPSIKDASHQSCINCHVKMDVDPVKCGECHQVSSN